MVAATTSDIVVVVVVVPEDSLELVSPPVSYVVPSSSVSVISEYSSII